MQEDKDIILGAYTKRIADRAPGMIAIYNIQTGVFVYVNESIRRVLGYEPKDFIEGGAEFVSSLMHPDDVDRIWQENAKALERANDPQAEVLDIDPIVTFEYRVKNKEGKWRWLRTDGSVFDRSSDGKVKHVMNISIDVTQQKEKERLQDLRDELQESKDELEAIFNNVLDGISVQDNKGNLLYANTQAIQFLGCKSLEEIRTTPAAEITARFEMFDESGNPLKPEQLPGRYALKGVSNNEILLQWRNKATGVGGWSEVKSRPVFNPDGSIKFAVNIWRDVTHEKQMMQEFERSNRRSQHILESIADGFFALDTQWQFTYINKQAEQFFGGRSRYDLIGKNILEEFPEAKKLLLYKKVQMAIIQNETLRVQEFFSETKQWLELTIYPTKDGLAVYLRDITGQKQISDLNAKLAAIVEFSDIAIMSKDLDGKITTWNKGAEHTYGYSAEEMMGNNVSILVPDGTQNDEQYIIDQILKGHGVDHFETKRRRKDGKIIDVSITTSAVKNEKGEIIGISSIARDVTDTVATEEFIKQREERFRAMIENSSDGVVLMDEKGVINYCTNAVERILGFDEKELVGRSFFELIYPEDLERTSKLFAELASSPARPISSEFRALNKDGKYIWIEGVGNNLLHLKSVGAIVANFRDVSKRKKIEENLQYHYHHDILTDLPNRTYLNERLSQALEEAQQNQEKFAFMILDLDRFKQINESLGHAIGDRLIQEVALRIRSCLDESHILSRLGGDEFAILIPKAETEESVALVANKILEDFKPAFNLDQYELFISPSIGISLYPYDGKEASMLLKNAEAALYRAKEHGRNNYQFYTTTMNAASYERLTMESKLRHAIENNEFELFYQPQVDVYTGKIVGAEELIRWRRPDSTIVMPDRFIPLAEANGLIEPIGAWVLQEALKQAKIWHDSGFKLVMAINLSARQFKQKNLEKIIIEALETSGVDSTYIEFELTESVLAENPEKVMEIMNALKQRGIRFCLDDFSTGYSSLKYIKQFPVDMLKIERNFMNGIPMDVQNSAIAKSIITLGKSLGMEVTAEGVESKKQLVFLREYACNRAQGYLFNGAMPAHSLSEILGEDRYVSVVNSLSNQKA